MTVDSVIQFIQRVNRDAVLRNRIYALPTGDLAELINIASELGYHFTKEEFKEVVSPKAKPSTSGDGNSVRRL